VCPVVCRMHARRIIMHACNRTRLICKARALYDSNQRFCAAWRVGGRLSTFQTPLSPRRRSPGRPAFLGMCYEFVVGLSSPAGSYELVFAHVCSVAARGSARGLPRRPGSCGGGARRGLRRMSQPGAQPWQSVLHSRQLCRPPAQARLRRLPLPWTRKQPLSRSA